MPDSTTAACLQPSRRLLTKLGEPAEVQGKAPARAPPYFASKLVRRHFGQPEQQLALFH